MKKILLLICIICAFTDGQRRPPMRPRNGQGRNMQQNGGGQQQGQRGNVSLNNQGGQRGKLTDASPGKYNIAENGKGYCTTWAQYTIQTAKVWETFPKGDFATLQSRVLDWIDQNKCIRQGPPTKSSTTQCTGTIGHCDSANMRTQSLYYSTELVHNGDNYRLVITNGIPNHCYQVEATKGNPNSACEHYKAVLLPTNPSRGSKFREHAMGSVGIAISGGFFYNHKSAEDSCNSAAVTEKATFDPCDGHADQGCRYHYHKAPVCISGWDSCVLMGYMNDGYPVYGKCTVRLEDGNNVEMNSGYKLIDGKNGCDASHFTYNDEGATLDQANGYYFEQAAESTNGDSKTTFESGTYAYFFTPEFPFIMPGTYSEVQQMCTIDVDQLFHF